VTRGRLTQRAGSPGLKGSGTATAVPHCDRMVRDSTTVTLGSIQETNIALSNGTIGDTRFLQNGDPKCTLHGMSNFKWPYLLNGWSDPLYLVLFGGSNIAIYSLTESRITAGRHLGILQRHRVVSLRQHGFHVSNTCSPLFRNVPFLLHSHPAINWACTTVCVRFSLACRWH